MLYSYIYIYLIVFTQIYIGLLNQVVLVAAVVQPDEDDGVQVLCLVSITVHDIHCH